MEAPDLRGRGLGQPEASGAVNDVSIVVASVIGALGPFVIVALIVLAVRKVRSSRRDQDDVGSSSA